MSFRSMMRGLIAMPGKLMYDGRDPDLFDHFAIVAQRCGVYTVRDYATIIGHLVETWRIASLQVTGKADIAANPAGITERQPVAAGPHTISVTMTGSPKAFIKVAVSQPRPPNTALGLAGYWRFDGTPLDASGTGRDLVATGSYAAGLLGQAFTGSYFAESSVNQCQTVAIMPPPEALRRQVIAINIRRRSLYAQLAAQRNVNTGLVGITTACTNGVAKCRRTSRRRATSPARTT